MLVGSGCSGMRYQRQTNDQTPDEQRADAEVARAALVARKME